METTKNYRKSQYLRIKEMEKRRELEDKMDKLEAEYVSAHDKVQNIWKIGRTNYPVWQLMRMKILAAAESKKA